MKEQALDENVLSKRVIGAAIEVHRELGVGLLESAYEAALVHELRSQGLSCARQLPLPAHYKGVDLEEAYRLDIVVENCLILEIKSVQQLAPIHSVQLLTYLRFSGMRLGLLLNFHAASMREGVRRVVNRL